MLSKVRTSAANVPASWSPQDQSRIATSKILYWLGCSAISWYTRSMLELDVVWRGALPKGPKIFAANHPTTTDPFFLLSLIPEQMSILVTGSAFQVPGFGRYLRQAGHIPVVGGSGGATLATARRLLEAGQSVGIFPEGALSPLEGGLGFHPPRSGVARLALSTGLPVVPVGIGLDPARIRYAQVKPDGEPIEARIYWQGPYAVTVGRAIRYKGDVEDWAYVRAVARRIMVHISRLAGQSVQRIEQSRRDAATGVSNRRLSFAENSIR